jgi:hypothetical protein
MRGRLEKVIERVLRRYASFLVEEDIIRLTKHLSHAIVAEAYSDSVGKT